MRPTVQVVSTDLTFAELLCSKLQSWGLTPALGDEYLDAAVTAAAEGAIDVLLLDIRQQPEALLGRLAAAMKSMAGLEVVLINNPGCIGASMEGMRIGASDELTPPIDAGIFRKKVLAAVRRHRRATSAAAGKKKSLWKIFDQTMSAATFAQAGEYEIALELIDETETKPPIA